MLEYRGWPAQRRSGPAVVTKPPVRHSGARPGHAQPMQDEAASEFSGERQGRRVSRSVCGGGVDGGRGGGAGGSDGMLTINCFHH